jgi:hypothetical protein
MEPPASAVSHDMAALITLAQDDVEDSLIAMALLLPEVVTPAFPDVFVFVVCCVVDCVVDCDCELQEEGLKRHISDPLQE